MPGYRQGCTQWYLELGGKGVNSKGPGGVTPPGGQADHRDDGDTWGGRGVGIYPSGGGTWSLRNTHHNGLHYEEEGDHIIKGGMLPYLWTMCGGGAYARDYLDDEMVELGHGKWTLGV